MAAPSIRPIRNCLYGRHIGCTRRHRLIALWPCTSNMARRQALTFKRGVLGRVACAHIVERTSRDASLFAIFCLSVCPTIFSPRRLAEFTMINPLRIRHLVDIDFFLQYVSDCAVVSHTLTNFWS